MFLFFVERDAHTSALYFHYCNVLQSVPQGNQGLGSNEDSPMTLQAGEGPWIKVTIDVGG